jgi:hypothetical protein
VEVGLPGLEVRPDYFCCTSCAKRAMELRRKQFYLMSPMDSMDSGFPVIYSVLDTGEEVRIGRDPDMEGPVKFYYSLPEENEAKIRLTIQAVFNKNGFLVEWDPGGKFLTLHGGGEPAA